MRLARRIDTPISTTAAIKGAVTSSSHRLRAPPSGTRSVRLPTSPHPARRRTSMAMLAHWKLIIASAATRPPVLKGTWGPAHMELRNECCSIAETRRRPTMAGTVAQAIEARARSRHAPTVCGIPAGRNRARTSIDRHEFTEVTKVSMWLSLPCHFLEDKQAVEKANCNRHGERQLGGCKPRLSKPVEFLNLRPKAACCRTDR